MITILDSVKTNQKEENLVILLKLSSSLTWLQEAQNRVNIVWRLLGPSSSDLIFGYFSKLWNSMCYLVLHSLSKNFPPYIFLLTETLDDFWQPSAPHCSRSSLFIEGHFSRRPKNTKIRNRSKTSAKRIDSKTLPTFRWAEVLSTHMALESKLSQVRSQLSWDNPKNSLCSGKSLPPWPPTWSWKSSPVRIRSRSPKGHQRTNIRKSQIVVHKCPKETQRFSKVCKKMKT